MNKDEIEVFLEDTVLGVGRVRVRIRESRGEHGLFASKASAYLTSDELRRHIIDCERVLNELNVPNCQPHQVDSAPMNDTERAVRDFQKSHQDPVSREVARATGVDDPINPKHYQGDLVMRIIEHFKLGFALGNCIKYILRHRDKGGVEDLKKAAWYLDREIKARIGQLPDNGLGG